MMMSRKPKMYLSEMYSQENYLIAYRGMLNPLQRSNYWDTEGEGMVLPPNIVIRPKRRPKTARRRDSSEGSKHPSRSSKQRLTQNCSNCHRTGHRRPSCPDAAIHPPRPTHQQENQSQVLDEGTSGKKKRGRPKGSKTRPNNSIEEFSQTNPLPPSQVFINIRAMARAQSQNARGRSDRRRGRGRGRNNEVIMLEGFGIWHGDHGEVAYRDPSASQATIIQDSTLISTQDVHKEEHTQASCAHNSEL
ncbi:uncharacterized protein LOC109822834 [Asparagus officinalis]|uniref:uncharacterized protein LOC109822834 n=1 Tax=Asparagus officinalis TaxID=4686 RepID=UPI00098E7CCC|nr:uncharacterized protein LOC109822834 [Asparagus officinalis]XP_020244682.1 uncharacterized protein LOC109822834 [Asparagus officinalis]XP_020244683.1 uncharacterized protein LOC109822834 [Asparagus officinalis]